MIVLNLLPYRLRDENQKRQVRAVCLFSGVLVLAMCSAMLLFYSLQTSLAAEVESLRATVYNRSLQDARQTIATQHLPIDASVIEGYRIYSDSLREVTSLLPSGVTLTRLVLDGAEGEVSLSGTTDLPADVRKLQRALEAVKSYGGIQIETEQLDGSGNTSFSFKGQVTAIGDEVVE